MQTYCNIILNLCNCDYVYQNNPLHNMQLFFFRENEERS